MLGPSLIKIGLASLILALLLYSVFNSAPRVAETLLPSQSPMMDDAAADAALLHELSVAAGAKFTDERARQNAFAEPSAGDSIKPLSDALTPSVMTEYQRDYLANTVAVDIGEPIAVDDVNCCSESMWVAGEIGPPLIPDL